MSSSFCSSWIFFLISFIGFSLLVFPHLIDAAEDGGFQTRTRSTSRTRTRTRDLTTRSQNPNLLNLSLNLNLQSNPNVNFRIASPLSNSSSNSTVVTRLRSSSDPKSTAKGSKQKSAGGYSRTYSEKRYEIHRNSQQEKHTKQKVETKTQLIFSGGNGKNGKTQGRGRGSGRKPGNATGRRPGTGAGTGQRRPIGATILTSTNNTFTYPTGKNVTSQFRNVTFFGQNGEDEEEDRGEDNVHPLAFDIDIDFDEEEGENENEEEGKKDKGANIPKNGHGYSCETGSCYPATGNLLVGRESRLSATSTCGLKGEERYCIVSHLEDKKKCFLCDSTPQHARNPLLSHRIENVLQRFYPGTNQRSWWQSENGVENVTIQLDLEAEFHFTHLIITFKTFRPAAMLVERSSDFGKTWKVYRYFAHDCNESFPGIPKEPARSITDVICESRYSAVAPSSEGEVIFRVLPQNIPIPDPFSQEVQNLLKITNFRVNFTKLHTLGDDLLDKRSDIQEKYYYAISEMVVRGSCSCHGHASKCLPLPGAQIGRVAGSGVLQNQQHIRTGVVHGRCECTHNTTGLNCEECAEFYRDLPWKPAFGKQTNACKRCDCNGHSKSCHFDPDVYEASGFVSGGVCENCTHNTMGQKCQLCTPFFYLSPNRSISNVNACQRCECDSRGSADGGNCDSYTDAENGLESGRCHCKEHAAGKRCDECTSGYWNLTTENPQGCQPCSCNILGTIGKENGSGMIEACDILTGECKCKRSTTGRDCGQCLPQFWGIAAEDPNGCRPCDCDVGGAQDNNCDVFSGQCRCRAHVSGRNCNVPEQGYFAPSLDHFVYEAEVAKISPNSQVILREPRVGVGNASWTWTGVGFVRAAENSYLEFTIDNIVTSMEYEILIRYEPQEAKPISASVVVTSENPPNPNGPCSKTIRAIYRERIPIVFHGDSRDTSVKPPICLEAGNLYRVKLDGFQRRIEGDDDETSVKDAPSLLIDSIVLIPRVDDLPFFKKGDELSTKRKEEFDLHKCGAIYSSKNLIPPECQRLLYTVGFAVFDGAFDCQCDAMGSTSSICEPLGGRCQCKLNVEGRKCDRCAPGTFGLGPEGCQPCECNSIGAVDNFCDAQSGQCRCRANTFGLRCDQCQPGYWNFPNCQPCDCNGLADLCDQVTGTCVDCRDNSTGDTCDRCVEGYFGDPRIGTDIPCRPCPCPGTTESGHSFASRCALDHFTNDVVCECKEGYTGPRCDTCQEDYYGDPKVPGGECQPCFCNDNVDLSRPAHEYCDPQTGKCLNCLFNTGGFHCERCKDGFYGDAINQNCQRCLCDLLGTNSSGGHCDPVTGQCRCLANVMGRACNHCMRDHWKIASGDGCEPCSCDPVGSISPTCHEYNGQCQCHPGFGGRKCDTCQENYWGDPNVQCYPCDCKTRGSATNDCDRNTGSCLCISPYSGSQCDECARGYIGAAPDCAPCGECFQTWDRVMTGLKARTLDVVESASKIKQNGSSSIPPPSAHSHAWEFETMNNKIGSIKRMLENSMVSASEVDELQEMIDNRTALLTQNSDQVDSIERLIGGLSHRLLFLNISVNGLNRDVNELQESADSFIERAIQLQENDVQGALNLTRRAQRKSLAAVHRAEGAKNLVKQSESQRRRVQILLSQFGPQMSEMKTKVIEALPQIEAKLESISTLFPEMNTLICDNSQTGDEGSCDLLCGGAGCGKCGGISCDGGAVNIAASALKYAQDALREITKKSPDVAGFLQMVTRHKQEIDQFNNVAQIRLAEVIGWKNYSDNLKSTLEEVSTAIEEFLATSGSTPAEIQTLAQEVQILSINITIRPEQAEQLVQQIRENLATLADIGERMQITITEEDFRELELLKIRAETAFVSASEILEESLQFTKELENSQLVQKEAERLIEKAGDDITSAGLDLKKIGEETSEMEKQLNETGSQIEHLKTRVSQLQTKTGENERRREEARSESESALINSKAVQEKSYTLKQEFADVKRVFDGKVQAVEDVQEKEVLTERTNRLEVNVNRKLKQLDEMEKEYTENERKIDDLGREIDSLIYIMEQQMRGIRRIEDYHRNCNS